MPTYVYVCDNCGAESEAFQSITAEPLSYCEACQTHKLRRRPMGGAGLSFKGSGFYSTDYASDKKSSGEQPSSQKPSSPCCPCGKNKHSCSG